MHRRMSAHILGKLSEAFKVLIHRQGEYADEREGINDGPGHHTVIALSEKMVGPMHACLNKWDRTKCTKR